MVKIGLDHSITFIKGDSNFILFKCLNHIHEKEVDRVIFNIVKKDKSEIYRKELKFESNIIALEIEEDIDIVEGDHLYNLKMCFKNGRKITFIREKKITVLEEVVKC